VIQIKAGIFEDGNVGVSLARRKEICPAIQSLPPLYPDC
jgi:hypothetical protein